MSQHRWLCDPDWFGPSSMGSVGVGRCLWRAAKFIELRDHKWTGLVVGENPNGASVGDRNKVPGMGGG